MAGWLSSKLKQAEQLLNKVDAKAANNIKHVKSDLGIQFPRPEEASSHRETLVPSPSGILKGSSSEQDLSTRLQSLAPAEKSSYVGKFQELGGGDSRGEADWEDLFAAPPTPPFSTPPVPQDQSKRRSMSGNGGEAVSLEDGELSRSPRSPGPAMTRPKELANKAVQPAGNKNPGVLNMPSSDPPSSNGTHSAASGPSPSSPTSATAPTGPALTTSLSVPETTPFSKSIADSSFGVNPDQPAPATVEESSVSANLPHGPVPKLEAVTKVRGLIARRLDGALPASASSSLACAEGPAPHKPASDSLRSALPAAPTNLAAFTQLAPANAPESGSPAMLAAPEVPWQTPTNVSKPKAASAGTRAGARQASSSRQLPQKAPATVSTAELPKGAGRLASQPCSEEPLIPSPVCQRLRHASVSRPHLSALPQRFPFP
ncbi:hypothetical protein CYMTET_27224 [Cymbomonas tetramitiformis]|uniref:Uncharacterized protein n=1 Tax=Cymbomonas tetramitiformis TaxID=36881 RepID=A0AAE0FQG5_9CHLO|nr:hypothetical protein CYMTET_27224 [Cymbomonas tetramitiformis]